MALKYKYAKQEEIPAEQTGFYVERDGAFILDAEGATDKTKADEMRNHNIELRKQLEQLNTRFEGIDPKQVRQLAAEKQRLEEERQLKAGEVDKVVENRVKSLKADWDKQVIAQAGRELGTHLMVDTQRPELVNPSITGAATELVCFKLIAPEALRAVEKIGGEKVIVQALPPGTFKAYNRLSSGTLGGRMF